MPLTRQDLKTIAAMISAISNERPQPIGVEGRVLAGSYHPGDGTIQAIIGDTDAAYQLAIALGDNDSTFPLIHPRVPIASHDPNDQYGPRGGEPCLLLPTQTGWTAKLYCDADTAGPAPPGPGPYFSVKAPAGERWTLHRNDSGEIDSGVQLTNSGPTAGDNLGGTIVGHKGALTQAQTASGHQIALNDTAQTIGTTTAGGLTDLFDDVKQAITRTAAPGLYTIVDGAGNAISHVVPDGGGIGLGGLFADMSTDLGAINNEILTTFGSNINSANLQSLVNLGNAMVTAGIPNASNIIPLIVASLIQDVKVPAGSATVLITS